MYKVNGLLYVSENNMYNFGKKQLEIAINSFQDNKYSEYEDEMIEERLYTFNCFFFGIFT